MIYIDSAYPASDSIIETEQRANQMNNLLRVISDLQMSCNYGGLLKTVAGRVAGQEHALTDVSIVSSKVMNVMSLVSWKEQQHIFTHAFTFKCPCTVAGLFKTNLIACFFQITWWPCHMSKSIWCQCATSRSCRSLWRTTTLSKIHLRDTFLSCTNQCRLL